MTKKLSGSTLLFLFIAFLSVVMLVLLYVFTESLAVMGVALAFILFLSAGIAIYTLSLRRSMTGFSDDLCQTLDTMLDGQAVHLPAADKDDLFQKVHHRLIRLYEAMESNRRQVAEEQASLQELVSDISHQVKTPITNMKMIHSTLLEQSITEAEQKTFLQSASLQLEKLDFLMQAMVKTSRLEAGVISPEAKKQPIYDTLAAALGGILLAAEEKGIQISVECPEDIVALHDRKWTAEALFNLLDNAVKYTPSGGIIQVRAEQWEMYVKIDIIDTGKGIQESRQGSIFKRFYREPEVCDVDGIGLGLYLARKIITLQSGFIRLASDLETGSVFSVFLPRK